ncbi:hypothetical protein DMUE_0238 [Dictyocoela muelleri]|nr:hypothetical protein DMUE_0238 [Dictyocoela muelleri]
MEEIQIIESQKGKKTIGIWWIYIYIYNEQKINTDYIYWRCVRRNCSGRLHSDILIQSVIFQATHWLDEEKEKIVRLKVNNIIKKALDENKTVFDEAILDSCQYLNEDEMKLMGNRENLRDYFVKRRNAQYKISESEDLELLQIYKNTFDKKLFLQFDNLNKDDRVIIFFL